MERFDAPVMLDTIDPAIPEGACVFCDGSTFTLRAPTGQGLVWSCADCGTIYVATGECPPAAADEEAA